EPVLQRGRLGCGRRCKGVRMDVDEREVAEREADAAVELSLDTFDLAECPSRKRAFVVAVFEDEAGAGRAADVISVVERLDPRQVSLAQRATRHQKPTTFRISTTW